ncbi:D-alanyl-D-alanine carboxypeptidase (penicillin-binding protein 5/6) [Gracilibacillus orientalis]|uniref:D-alanyl-D-alanine carboxypeptidase (Penicillin-binding protein 5/6) n=1 Tax=Gracilibacillus orientalis TaxID=334253 RepID=A0A1I4Q0K7_9BACI|nr:D-alanyl-D-alanine carboxypeptidase family protein [Gracilibacillus orientalis]SFM33608.1 D-alanyl-D-alanine carboxypeptidase (penicillin-binding protein 5/6) [Gracilibacillus orientalis]
MKRLLLVMLLVVSGCNQTGDEATLPSKKVQQTDKIKKELIYPDRPLDRFWNITDIDLDASSVILINADSGHVIYEKNSDVPLPTASMSKMMTELLVLKEINSGELDWDSEIVISDYAYDISHHPGYASVDLSKDRHYTVEELFQAMAIHSANGATIALAEAVSGSEELFVQQMNKQAQQLQLKDTQFVNTTGLDNLDLGDYYSVGSINDTNTMSAQDLAKLAEHLITTYPELLEISNQPAYVLNGQKHENTNWMLEGDLAFNGVDGLKTGYTSLAGYCFTGTIQKDGVRLISVVMGTSSEVERFIETETLYKKAFESMY